jgi:hypothetical protein
VDNRLKVYQALVDLSLGEGGMDPAIITKGSLLTVRSVKRKAGTAEFLSQGYQVRWVSPQREVGYRHYNGVWNRKLPISLTSYNHEDFIGLLTKAK